MVSKTPGRNIGSFFCTLRVIMNHPVARNVWIICHYGEQHPDGSYINFYEVLDSELHISLSMVREKFPADEFEINVRNVSEDSVDFAIYDQQNDPVAEVEFWPEGYEPELL